MATTETQVGTAATSRAQIEIAPNPAFIDEDVIIRVRGAAPGVRVTLRTEVKDDADRIWEARGSYVADAAGCVNVASQESLSGTYRGCDAMGLFWSMKLKAAPHSGRATFRKDSSAPDTVALTVEIAGQTIATCKLDRRWLAPGAQIRDAGEDANEEGFAGRLFIPLGREPHPVVIVLGGSGGGYDLDKAAVLARHGFAALSLAYFGLPGLPPWLHRVPLEYFARAMAWLGRQPEVDARCIGVLGISRGAELALLLSPTFPEIRAVVAYAPSAVAWGSGGRDKATGEIIPCWTRRGEAIPFAPLPLRGFIARSALPVGMLRRPVKFRNLFRAALGNHNAIERAQIPVERTRGPILLISGGDDHVWPASRMAEMICARLRARNFSHSVEHLHYPKAGHELRYPFLPTTARTTRPAGLKFAISFGGSAEADAEAQEDAWRRAIAFFRNSL
ncbi:MAG TPA: acyl-CoA thioester hydrolase/BAAT C-terminal domain-containing protein [Candidatus Dormibacteraeota bacterium]|nr:acyl-CoA thioester hydrolase/BAAT C-terminal domain-containing protein [Candidatus Dormibacteraeota bacterium]